LACRKAFECDKCAYVTKFKSSAKKSAGYDINIQSVYGSQNFGRTGLSRLCGVLDLREPISSNAYEKMQGKLLKKSKEHSARLMQDVAKRLKTQIIFSNPADVEVTVNGSFTYNAAVTVDGAWMKRGHASKYGVVFVMSVLTGEVLDYSLTMTLKSLFCQKCWRRPNQLLE
jgi:hypothetical protein